MKTFHATKCRAYPHEKLNTSKGVIKSRGLVLATEEEIASALEKQGVTNLRRISIRKGKEQIQTDTYILTFNQPRTPKEVKIGYCLVSRAVRHNASCYILTLRPSPKMLFQGDTPEGSDTFQRPVIERDRVGGLRLMNMEEGEGPILPLQSCT